MPVMESLVAHRLNDGRTVFLFYTPNSAFGGPALYAAPTAELPRDLGAYAGVLSWRASDGEVSQLNTWRDWERAGVATLLYDEASKRASVPLKAPEEHTPDAAAFIAFLHERGPRQGS